MPRPPPIRIPAIALLAVALAAPLAAQEILGRTLDAATGEPLTSVDVALYRGDGVVARSVTDGGGFFRWSEIPEGRYRVTASLLGYRETEARDVVIEGRRVELVVRLSVDPVPLDSLVVVGRARPRLSVDPVESFRMREMIYGRAGLGTGHFFDREAIARIDPLLPSHVAKRVPALMTLGRGMRGQSFLTGGCPRGPAVFLNGVPFRVDGKPLEGLDSLFPLLPLEAVEVYTNSTQVPLELTNFETGTCGVVAFWTGEGYRGLADDGTRPDHRLRAEVLLGGYIPMAALDAGPGVSADMAGGASLGFAFRYGLRRWKDADVRLVAMLVPSYGLEARTASATTTVRGDLTFARLDFSIRPWTLVGRDVRAGVGLGVRKYDPERGIIPELCTFAACQAAESLARPAVGPLAWAGIELELIPGRLYLSLGDNISRLHGATQHDLTLSASLAMRR